MCREVVVSVVVMGVYCNGYIYYFIVVDILLYCVIYIIFFR